MHVNDQSRDERIQDGADTAHIFFAQGAMRREYDDGAIGVENDGECALALARCAGATTVA